MKKLICMFLAVALLASFCTAAMAESYTETYADIGVTITYPELFSNPTGVFTPQMYGILDDGIYFGDFIYFAMPEDELEAAMTSEDLSEEDIDAIRAKNGELGFIIAVSDVVGLEGMCDYFGIEDPENCQQVGIEGDLTWYFYPLPYEFDWDAAFEEEFKAMQDALIEALRTAEYTTPFVFGSELVGNTVTFETTDLDDNPVTSKDLFAAHEITMVNCWTTWCGHCVDEMPELAETNKRLAESDCAIIGILMDGTDEEAVEEGKQILAETGVDYPVLLPNQEIKDALAVRCYPTTYFIGRDGTILTAPMEGAPADMTAPNPYEEIIASLLVGEEVSMPVSEDPVSANDDGIYRVIVKDADGTPIEGVTVQFCDDQTCRLGKTDADGVAAYEVAEGDYTVHILKVPAGFEKTDDEFHTGETYSDLFIVLEKAS